MSEHREMQAEAVEWCEVCDSQHPKSETHIVPNQFPNPSGKDTSRLGQVNAVVCNICYKMGADPFSENKSPNQPATFAEVSRATKLVLDALKGIK